jgi:hypothetical protein
MQTIVHEYHLLRIILKYLILTQLFESSIDTFERYKLSSHFVWYIYNKVIRDE